MPQTQTQIPVRVRADVFPAILVVAPADSPHPATILSYPQPDDPHGRRLLDKVRVLVAEDTVYVFADSSAGPQLIFSESLQDYTAPVPLHRRRTRDASKPSEALAVTGSGKSLAWARQGGCGCGSRLKTFDPFKVILATARTSETTGDVDDG